MNVALNPQQSNCKRGDITDVAAVDLTGKEGFLVKLTSTGFALPTSTDDHAPFVLADGGPAAALVSAEAPSTNENFRVFLKGACARGDVLSLADPSTPADAGKLRKQPTTTGTWRSFAVAEEAGVDGQSLRCRLIPERTTTV